MKNIPKPSCRNVMTAVDSLPWVYLSLSGYNVTKQKYPFCVCDHKDSTFGMTKTLQSGNNREDN